MRVNNSRIYVCQSGTCRSKGSDAAIVEIEELAKLVGGCDVEAIGCLGYCSQGPAVEVVQRSKRRFHVKVNTFRKSAAVVKDATGKEPPIGNLTQEAESRLSIIRETKRREYFTSTYQWNKALSDLTKISINQTSLRPILQHILKVAGYPDTHLCDLLKPSHHLEMPTSIEGYVSWTLQSVEIVSKHSAIFQFATGDLRRGTPHPRGRAKMAQPVTWHVTMLGEVGSNGEGPLPWIERDYTPISSALEWERGRCEILIKIYNDGVLSNWLQQRTSQSGKVSVWLSRPIRTLSVPSLVADDDDGFRPKSVLLLLAGTGIVALPQVLAHRDPYRLLGIPTPRYKQLQCSIDLIHSCREDDILLLPEIKQYCVEGMKPHSITRGLRNYTLLPSKEKQGQGESSLGVAPFQEHFNEYEAVEHNATLKGIPNAKILKSRLNKNIIADAIGRLVQPYRVLVSGPDTFNSAARDFLEECEVDPNQVTILSA